MPERGRELVYSVALAVAITAGYAYLARDAARLPAASSLLGHGIGVVGIALMLMTETLYSLRKHSSRGTAGSMAAWLRFHIVTGIVGPYLVLLHSALRFEGLAGATLALTGVVVASGAVGRYLHASAPREGGGPVTARSALAAWHAVHVPLTWVLFAFALIHGAAAVYYGALQR